MVHTCVHEDLTTGLRTVVHVRAKLIVLEQINAVCNIVDFFSVAGKYDRRENCWQSINANFNLFNDYIPELCFVQSITQNYEYIL